MMQVKTGWEALRRGIMKIGRRNWVVISALALICGAVVLNLVLFNGADEGFDYDTSSGMSVTEGAGDGEVLTDKTTDDAAFFSATQVSRQRARDEAMEVLRAVVDNEDAVDAVKGQALSDINRIALDIEREANIETLVTAKGFAQCVAVVNGDSANVIVKSDGLLPNEIAQINEIVYEQAGIVPANVKIIEKSS